MSRVTRGKISDPGRKRGTMKPTGREKPNTQQKDGQYDSE